MMRWAFLVGAVWAALSSGAGCSAGRSDPCSGPPCSNEGDSICQGSQVMRCAWAYGDGYDEPACQALVWQAGSDCDDIDDAECSAGACVREEGRCPQGSLGFCENGAVQKCHGDRLLAQTEGCETQGLTCFDVDRPEGETDGVCALRNEPCIDQTNPSGLECQGNMFVDCSDGYPIYEHACAENERCSEQSGLPECGLTLPCPDDGTNLCSNDQVYGCLLSSTPTVLRDCRTTGAVCTSFEGNAFCSSRPEGPPAPSFVAIAGGTFAMGPRGMTHDVTVNGFAMMDREATVGAYAGCIRAGSCTPPDMSGFFCNQYDIPHWELDADLPMVCIDREQADAFCSFLGARLPFESEWEFAMRNGGEDVLFPWGADAMSCEHAIVSGSAASGCDRREAWPGCSRDDDRTSAGICDLAGNVRELVVSDTFLGATYARGASGDSGSEAHLREPAGSTEPGHDRFVGFRCVR